LSHELKNKIQVRGQKARKMVGYAKYSDEFKKAIVEKYLSNPENSVNFIAREAAIPASTLKNWLNKSNKLKGFAMNKKNSRKLKPEEKFDILVLTSSMNEAQKSEYCRSHGLYPEELEEWKSECIKSFKTGSKDSDNNKQRSKEKELEREIKTLEKDLNRKDKALSETAALLVLKKKAQAIWGEPEEEK
jgi:transposase-like protein